VPPQRTSPPTTLFPAYLLPLFVALAAAAYRVKKQREQEEEEMTSHLTDPATASEFKIIRGGFQKPDKLRAMLDEEARAGWELFELLDAGRARLRRPTACRARDGELTQDPYRTVYSAADPATVLKVLLVLGGILVVTIVTVGVLIAVNK
jgi:hypothetical protein